MRNVVLGSEKMKVTIICIVLIVVSGILFGIFFKGPEPQPMRCATTSIEVSLGQIIPFCLFLAWIIFLVVLMFVDLRKEL